MFTLLFKLEELLDLFLEVLMDSILEIHAPRIDITKKPPRLGR